MAKMTRSEVETMETNEEGKGRKEGREGRVRVEVN